MKHRIIWALLAVNLWQFLAVPLLPPWWALTLIPLALLSNTLWAAIHEAIHRNSPAWAGMSLSCVFGSSFHFLKAGHITHHALNRTTETLELVPENESLWAARVRYYAFLCGGLYLAEVLVPVAFLFSRPRPKSGFLKCVFQIANRQGVAIALESIAAISFLALSAALYGERWPLFVSIVAVRAFLISWLDYIYHYGNPVGDILSANNLWLPGTLEKLVLNFNMHRNHHESPSTPWDKLLSGVYQDSFWDAALRVWRGPIKVK